MKNRTKSPLRRKCANLAKRSVMLLCSAVTLALALGLVGYVLYRGLPSITTSFLTTSPSYLNDNIGIFPNLLNTVYILIATLLIVLPRVLCMRRALDGCCGECRRMSQLFLAQLRPASAHCGGLQLEFRAYCARFLTSGVFALASAIWAVLMRMICSRWL